MQDFPLADELFLVHHDDTTGKPTVRRDLLGCGLVVALLGELSMQERVTVDADGRVAVHDESEHDDAAAGFVLATLAAQRRTHPVRTWTDNLDDTSYELVARRLVERGTVRRVHSRRLLRARPDTFPSAKREAATPALLLDQTLRQPRDADPQRAMLATLVATIAGENPLRSDSGQDRTHSIAAQLADELPPQLQYLATGLEAAVTARLLSIRR